MCWTSLLASANEMILAYANDKCKRFFSDFRSTILKIMLDILAYANNTLYLLDNANKIERMRINEVFGNAGVYVASVQKVISEGARNVFWEKPQ